MGLKRLEPGDPRPEFTCGDSDLDEFYHKDSILGCEQLMCVTYVITNGDGMAIAFFSVSNDSISAEVFPKSAVKRLAKLVPHEKRYSSLPAAKIARLGIANEFQGSGLGRTLLDALKGWFTISNKTGCRFLVVDAYKSAVGFYEKNGFKYVTGDDKNEDTRIMYYDLIALANRIRAEK